MTVMQRVIKPRTQRSKRALEHRQSKIIENTKQTLFLHGQNTSDIGRRCLKDFYSLKKQSSKHLQRKNPILPFEDSLPLERMSLKNDTAMFTMCTHSKKRPHNIIMGRMFDHHLLDMIELGIESFRGLSDFKNSKVSVGTKPCLVFTGPSFEEEEEYKRLKNFFIDFFRGVEATDIRLQGFEHCLMFTAFEGVIYLRSYKIQLKKSGTKVPRIELEEMGPSMSLKLRRNRLASADLFKKACKQPKQAKVSKVKNVNKDVFGSKLGRVHMTKQDINKLQTRKRKALKNKKVKPSKPSDDATSETQPMETA